MRKLVNSTYISLDGVIDNPMWTMPYFNDEAVALAGEQMAAADALVMGRATYEGFAAAWPGREAKDPSDGVAFFNGVKKYVASTTLKDPEWNNSEVLQGDAAEEVAKLKAQDGKDIVQYGFGSLTTTLIKAGLVDEVRFWIHPVIVGGPSLSSPLADVQASFDLIGTRTFSSGVIIASYRPKAA
jgi:dihydrofolate reductase